MAFGGWQLAILLSKLIAYGSFVSLTGGLLVLWLGATPPAARPGPSPRRLPWSPRARRRLVLLLGAASIKGTLAMLLFFLLQVGQVNQNGFAGVVDPFMISLLAQTPIGTGTALRVLGFLLFGFLILASRRPLLDSEKELPPTFWWGGLAAIALCCAGFAVLGHAVDLNVVAQGLIALHVLALGLWIGALFPLYTLCGTESGESLYPLMKRFGDWGWGMTLGLSVAGGSVLLQLIESPAELLSTSWGQLMGMKIVGVMCLLSLGALNKFRLVPALKTAGARPLQRSIMGEMLLAVVILALTAVLTTVTGPAHLMG